MKHLLKENELILIKNLEPKNVIFLHEHERKIYTILGYLSIDTIIAKYSDRFLFEYNTDFYKRDTNFLSIAQVSLFDTKLTAYINGEISILENNWTVILNKYILKFLNSRIYPNQNRDLKLFNLTIEELIREENKKIFLRLFNKQDTMMRKIIFNFLKFLAKNKETLDTRLKIKELFSLFNKEKRWSKTKVKSIIQIISEVVDIVDANDNTLTTTQKLLELSLDLDKFAEYYEEYCLNNILDKLAKRSSKEIIMKRTVNDIILDLSLGDKIDIFDSLNEDVKTNIINDFFTGTNAKIDEYEKATTFIQILRILQKVRNRCCHIKKIYDYITKNDRENEKVINFLSLNGITGVNSLNRIDIWGIIECLSIINGRTKNRRKNIKKKIMKMLLKIDFKLLPPDVKNFFVRQYKMDSWFDFETNKIKKRIA